MAVPSPASKTSDTLPSAKPPPPWRVEGPRVYLRDVRPTDVGPAYLQWMKDPEVARYLESRFSTHTLESLRAFVDAQRRDPSTVFFAIVLRADNRHIGNIKLGPIHWFHRHGDVGLLLGEKEMWGQGYAAEAITLATRFGFENLGLHHLTAGCYGPNAGSERAFLKAGWVREGVRKSYFRLDDGRWVDGFLLGVSREDWRPPSV